MSWWSLLKLKYGGVESRCGAAWKLASTGDRRAVGPLIKSLQHESRYLRAVAAWALGRIGDARAADALVAALNDRKKDVRQAAAEALGEIRDARGVESLLDALEDESGQVREAAAEALAAIGEPALEPLVTALQDEEGEVRRRAAWALGRIGNERAMEPLIQALRDAESDVQRSAAEALKALGWRPADETQRALLAIACTRWDEVASVGAAAVDLLAEALKGRAVGVRLAAVRALGKVRDDRVMPALANALRDESKMVRKAAAEVLESLNWTPKDDAERALLAVAHNQWRQAARLGAAAVTGLVVALKDKDHEIQKAAAEALGDVRAQEGISPLLAALRDDRGEVRRAAAEALGEIGDARAAQPLLEAFRDSCGDVRRAAAEALGRIGDTAIESLLAALHDEDWQMHELAAVALGEIGDARAVKPLLEALKEGQGDVRLAAAEALGKIGDPEALGPLLEVLREETRGVRGAVAIALGEIGDAQAARALLALVTDKSIGQCVVTGLTALLRQDTASMKTKDLQAILGIEGAFQLVYEGNHAQGHAAKVSGRYEVPLADLRELAREELARRDPTLAESLEPVQPSEAIKIGCRCGKEYRAKAGYPGSRAKCPRCGHVLVIPGPDR